MEQSWEVVQCLEYQQGVKIQFYSNDFLEGENKKPPPCPPYKLQQV